jgi:hypothetical protein
MRRSALQADFALSKSNTRGRESLLVHIVLHQIDAHSLLSSAGNKFGVHGGIAKSMHDCGSLAVSGSHTLNSRSIKTLEPVSYLDRRLCPLVYDKG